MRRSGLWLLGLVMVVGGIALAQHSKEGEPQQTFVLHVEGKEVVLQLNKPFKVQIGDKRVGMKLTAKPTRHFAKSGMVFDYPRNFSYEKDDDDSVTIWTLDGDNVVIMVQTYKAEGQSGLYVNAVVNHLVRTYGPATKKTATTRTLGGVKMTGWIIDAKVAAANIRQEVLGVPGNSPRILLLQDTPEDDGSSSAEFNNAVKVIGKSFSNLK